VTIIMPAAEIFVASLDNDKSYVYDRQTGLLTKGDQNLETQARQVAQQQIEQGALEDGILKLAQTNAASYLERLLRSLGFTSVVFVQATPAPASAPTSSSPRRVNSPLARFIPVCSNHPSHTSLTASLPPTPARALLAAPGASRG